MGKYKKQTRQQAKNKRGKTGDPSCTVCRGTQKREKKGGYLKQEAFLSFIRERVTQETKKLRQQGATFSGSGTPPLPPSGFAGCGAFPVGRTVGCVLEGFRLLEQTPKLISFRWFSRSYSRLKHWSIRMKLPLHKHAPIITMAMFPSPGRILRECVAASTSIVYLSPTSNCSGLDKLPQLCVFPSRSSHSIFISHPSRCFALWLYQDLTTTASISSVSVCRSIIFDILPIPNKKIMHSMTKKVLCFFTLYLSIFIC